MFSMFRLQEQMKEDYFKNLQSMLQQFESFLGNKKWFAGGENVNMNVLYSLYMNLIATNFFFLNCYKNY